ncbi:MAG TPA: hypothetical protein VNI61_11020 [Gemmatimonadales bacterium]|nr:hypothetical protein [Gemmatimonadales bacterium]
MHIELTEMLRCPEPHAQEHLVLSTAEMLGRMVRKGVVGCPVCRKEYPIREGVVDFAGWGRPDAPTARTPPHPASPAPHPDYPQTLQALLDLSGPGGIVALVGTAARYAEGLAGLMGGVHFVGINPPRDLEELPVLSLVSATGVIPLRDAVARGVVVGRGAAGEPWLAEAHRVLLRGRRWVVESDAVTPPPGIVGLASGEGLFVGEKR